MAQEFIEIISPNAKQQIDDIMAQVDKLAKKITDIPKFQLSNTPSGADSAIKQLTEDLAKQAKEIDNLKNKLAGLNQEKQKSNALTTQQKVDNAIILKQEKQQATLTSAYADAYAKLNAQRTIAKTKLQDLIASERASSAEIRKAQKEFDVLNKKVAAADKAVGRFSDANRKINGFASSVGNLMTAFGVGTGIYLAVDIAKNIFNTTKELQSLDLALKMVSGTTAEFAENQAFINNTAQKWGIEIKGLTQQYTQFYTAAKGILSDNAIKQVFESISKSGALMGLSVEKQNATFYAFEQMMSKGIVTAEELRKQLGNAMPGALRAAGMAYMDLHPQITSIQIAERELMKEMKRGAIDSATYVPLIVKNFEKLYGIENVNKVDTLRSAQERLQNSWTDLVRSMNESETGGISKFFTFVLRAANTLLNDLLRLNSSWDELYNKAKSRGSATGTQIGTERFNQGGGTVSGANASITVAEKRLSQLQKDYIENQKKGNELTDKIRKRHLIVDAADLAFQVDGDQERLLRLKENKERILEEISVQAGILKTVKSLKLGVGKEKSTPSGVKVETETEKKKRESDEIRAEEKRLKAIEEANKLEYDLKMSNLERDKDIIANELKNEKDSLEYKQTLADLYGLKEIQIAQAVYDEKKRLADGNDKLEKIALNEKNTAIENAYAESLARQQKIKEDYLKTEKDKTNEWYKNNPPFFTQSPAQKDALDAENKKGVDKAEEELERLKAMRSLMNEIFDDFGEATGFGNTMDVFAKAGKNGKTFWENLTGGEEGVIEMRDALFAGLAVMEDFVGKFEDAEEERYQRRLARLEKEKEVALGFAGDSAAAKAKIEADYDKKKKDLELKAFKRQQKIALANIAINTAQAVMSVLSTGGGTAYLDFGASAGILSAFVTAAGLAQAVMVMSQKPPEYWTGTDNAEAGLAWTQEKGTELILDKNNRIKSFGSDDGAQLTMMAKGDKVKTAAETQKIMFNSQLNNLLSDNGIKEAKIEIVNQGLTIDQMDSVLSKHFSNITTQKVVFDNNGIRQWSERNGNITIRNELRGSGQGFSV